VTREGAPVTRLQEQPSRVLAALTSQAGQLVTRDDLCRLLWPENSLVDADNGLNIAINKIRHALDDSAAQPRFIQTVPRRGYRFIANIERPPALTTPAAGSNVEPGADHVQSPTLSQPVQSVRRVRMFGFATAGLLIVVFVVASTWSIAPRSAAIRSAAVMPFVNLAGDRGLDYVVQGLTDTLATELAARGVPRVISPEATAHFKNSSASPGQMARELHADALVFGTVVRDGASFAVNVRLVNGQTERQLWVKRFVRASPIELTFSEDVLSGLAPALGLASVTAAPEAGRAPITAAARKEMRSASAKLCSCSARGLESSAARRSARRLSSSKPSSRKPLTTRNPAATYGLAKSDLMRVSKKTPSTPAGIVPARSNMASRSAGVVMLPRSAAAKKPRMIAIHWSR